MKSQMSRGSRYFIDSLKDKKDKDKFSPFMRSFELSSVMGDFTNAMLAFPFALEEKEEEDLERVYNYVRQVVLSKLSQKLLVTSYYKEEKNSHEAITTLINKITGGDSPEDSSLSGAKKIIFELQDS